MCTHMNWHARVRLIFGEYREKFAKSKQFSLREQEFY